MNTPSRRVSSLLALAALGACAKHSGDVASVTPGEIPIFETRSEVATGSDVHADYRVADFDGDGIRDMAVVSATGDLRVLIGNGGSFTLGQQTQLGGLPLWMTGGDFDEDGDEDLAIVRNADDATDIWLNDGSGTFVLGQTLTVGADALAVAVGDLDADGNLDLVVSRIVAPELFLAFGDGTGGFPSIRPLALPGGGRPFNIAIGDVTRDGDADLVVADVEQSRVIVYPGGSSYIGTFEIVLDVPGAPAAVALGDLSGDGLTDMVVSTFATNKYVVITEILGKDGFGNQSYDSFDIEVGAQPSVATVADVTGDGLADLVGCLAFNASMVVAPQLPGGGVGALQLLDASGLPLRPFVGPVDGAGTVALFALAGGGNRVNVWRSKATGQLAGARGYRSGLSTASWLEGADFDGDGEFEVATGSNEESRVVIMGKDGTGRLVVEATIEVGTGVYQLESVDLDRDGRTDLVVGVQGGVKVLRNTSSNGVLAFDVLPGSPAAIGSGDYPFGITHGDFDADGSLDLAVCDYEGGAVHIVPGTATPFVFGAETVLPLGGGLVDIAAADFTGDGRLDLAVSRATAADIVVLRNDGTTFVQAISQPVGQSPTYLVTADFNRDGRADLVVSNSASGTVGVLFGTSTGFTAETFAAGTAPTALLARDLTKDGNPDILVNSLASGDFRVLVGDGQGGFPLLPSFPGTLGASDAVLQDMDGDGRPELLISSLITNRVSLVQNISRPLSAN